MSSVKRFIASGFGTPVSVTAVSVDRSGAGSYSAAIATGDTSGGIFNGAVVSIVSGNTTDTLMNFFYDSKYIGHLEIPPNDSATNTDPPWEGVFVPLGGPVEMASSKVVKCCFMSGSMTAQVRALGGNF